VFRIASAFYVDAIVPGDRLRDELVGRLRHVCNKDTAPVPRRTLVVRG
jgi:hypothetical protein